MIERALVVLLILSAPMAAIAQEEEGEEESPLSGKVTLGYLATTGNTETSSLNGGFEAAYRLERWLHEAKGNTTFASEDNQTTVEITVERKGERKTFSIKPGVRN